MRSIRNDSCERLGTWLCRLACLAALGSPPAAAEDLPFREVDRCTSDTEPGGLNLEAALAAGGRIAFRCGGPATIRITKRHALTRSVEIDGANQITLDGNNESSLLAVLPFPSAPDVAIRLANLTIRRMSTPTGTVASVIEGFAVVISNSHILESESPIEAVGKQVLIENSSFESNRGVMLSTLSADVKIANTIVRSTNGPPLLMFGGNLDITDSNFDGNVRSIVLATSGTCGIRIARSQFTGNRSTSADIFNIPAAGGALRTQCPAHIENSSFVNNTTSADGGAINADAAASLDIRGSRFERNTAAGRGGAIAAPGGVVTLQYTGLTGNRAKIGGALFFGDSFESNARLEAHGVTFSGNIASDDGGAIAGTNTTVKILRGVFKRNQAQFGGAIWLNMVAQLESVIANTLFVLNKAPLGTFIGNTTTFINSTIVGSDGPGLVQFPAFTSHSPAFAIRLANTIVENNSGGNCRGGASSFLADGPNLQFPGTTCGSGITVAPALLDTFYAPIIGGPARARGNNALCQGAAVQGHDLYGEARPQAGKCSIGAVEGDLERIIHRMLASRSESPVQPQCPPGSPGAYPNCSGSGPSTKTCPPGSHGRWPNCHGSAQHPSKPYPKRGGCRPGSTWSSACKSAGRCGPGTIGIPPYCFPRSAIPSADIPGWIRRYEERSGNEPERRY
jgi:predicted outer membrane repeat protein